jgi:hypothetical protein
MVAVMATVLFAVGAVAIDMGNVYHKRADLQTNVDLAVLAAAAKLPDQAAARTTATDYLDRNEVYGQVATDLSDSDPDNGHIEFNVDGNPWKVRLTAPNVHVSWGMASIMPGVGEGVDVPARAAAGVGSPEGTTDMPFYAVSGGCSYGFQTISDNSGGPSGPPSIPLYPSTPTTNDAVLTSLTPSSSEAGVAIPSLRIDGSNLAGVTAVGFTTAAGDHVEVTGASLGVTATQVTVTGVPTTVTNQDDLWYVRVFKDGMWSAGDGNATSGVLRLTIGVEKLYCEGSSSGNFGSLRIGRNPDVGGPNETLSWNVADGIQPYLALFPGAPFAPNECRNLAQRIPVSNDEDAIQDGMNCVWSDPGLPANGLEEGLITGIGGVEGRLEEPSTSPCGRPNVSVLEQSINNDVLSCFFTDDSVRVGDVAKQAYSGPTGAISADIYESPRFFWVPLMRTDPNGTKRLSIQGFRPAFITDQPASGSRGSPGTTSPYNGLELNGTKVREMNVWLINPKALPESMVAEGEPIPYIGVGPKVINLVE